MTAAHFWFQCKNLKINLTVFLKDIFIAFMYTYLDIFAFSECFLPLAESDLVQTINSIMLYKMCMRTQAKMTKDYSLYATRQVNVVGQRSADRRATVDRSSADRKTLQLIKVIGEVCFNVITPVGRQKLFIGRKTCRILVGRLSVLM